MSDETIRLALPKGSLQKAVSYTHLDVYKRQEHGMANCVTGAHGKEPEAFEHRCADRRVPSMFEHVLKRTQDP